MKRPRILKASVNARAARGNGVARDISHEVRVQNGNGGPSANEGQGANWFGPLEPMNPTAPPQVAGRAMDYPSGYNLNIAPRAYDPIGFPTLRALADSYDLLRLIIETRKDQIEHLRWSFTPVDPTKRLDGALKERADRLSKFFRRPDKDHSWGQWIRSILEDLLVLDAPALYARPTLGGSLYALEQIDGATIKRVINDYGRTPDVGPAYQQVLKGFPAVDYTRQELIYRPRNTRVHKVYGFSPVEQIIMTVNIALRRQVFQLDFFTEGNMPEALIGVPDTWTPDQIRIFQDWFDNMLAGNLAERRRGRFVPNAVGKTYIPTKDTELFGAAEEWFARVCCYALSVNPAPFIKMIRSGNDNADEIAKQEGLGPLRNWIKDLIDFILMDHFGEEDLQFNWEEADELDAEKKKDILIDYTKVGLICINEARLKMGEQPYADEMFNKPMVMTAMGYAPITADMTSQQVMTGNDTRPGAPGGKDRGQQVKPGEEQPSQISGEKPKAKEGATTKTADFFQRVRKAATMPVQPNRPIVNETIQSTIPIIHKYLQRWGNQLASDVEELLWRMGVRKADEEVDLDKLLAQLDWDISQAFEHAMGDKMYSVASDAGRIAITGTEYAETDKMFNQVNQRAVAWASQRAAELVKIDGDKNMVDGTRSLMRAVISQGLADGLGAKEIAQSLRDGFAFSLERATNIATYEIASANSHGALEGYKEAESLGLSVKKGWSVDLNPCVRCQANADAGLIPLNEPFPSGDMAPSAHPHCFCALFADIAE